MVGSNQFVEIILEVCDSRSGGTYSKELDRIHDIYMPQIKFIIIDVVEIVALSKAGTIRFHPPPRYIKIRKSGRPKDEECQMAGAYL